MNHSSSQERPSQDQWARQPQASAPAPFAHSAPEVVIELQNKTLRAYDKIKEGEPTATIRLPGTGKKGEGAPLAYVHVPQHSPKGGPAVRPPFTVAGVNGELLCSVRSVGEGAYDVYGGDGTATGRITRRAGRVLPWPRRSLWTVQTVGGDEPLTAKRGTVRGWVLWLFVGFPVYLVVWALSALQGLIPLLFGDLEAAKKEWAWELELPSRALWRTSAPGVVLDYRGGGVFHLTPATLDHRLVYAQAVLHVWDGI